MDNVEVAKAVASLPLTVLLVLVLVGGAVEWWVYGRVHRAVVKDLEHRIALAEARAELWETRYLDYRKDNGHKQEAP